jgi:hypothetical protein
MSKNEENLSTLARVAIVGCCTWLDDINSDPGRGGYLAFFQELALFLSRFSYRTPLYSPFFKAAWETPSAPCLSSSYWAVYKKFASQSLHNRNIFLKKSGDVNDEANFSFFILLHKSAKPILPLLPSPSPPRANSNLYSPLTFSLTSARELKPYTPPLPSPSAHLSAHTFTLRQKHGRKI